MTTFLGGIIAYFSKRVNGTHTRINKLEDKHNGHTVRLATLEAFHMANQHRLTRIEETCDAMNEKQDQQTALLTQVAAKL